MKLIVRGSMPCLIAGLVPRSYGSGPHRAIGEHHVTGEKHVPQLRKRPSSLCPLPAYRQIPRSRTAPQARERTAAIRSQGKAQARLLGVRLRLPLRKRLASQCVSAFPLVLFAPWPPPHRLAEGRRHPPAQRPSASSATQRSRGGWGSAGLGPSASWPPADGATGLCQDRSAVKDGVGRTHTVIFKFFPRLS